MSKSRVFPVSFTSYVEAPRFSARYCASVAQHLLNRLPGDASTDEKKSVRIVVEMAGAVVSVINERERLGLGRVRPAALAFVNLWSAVFGVTSGFARFGGSVGADAQAILDAVFVEGVSFTKLNANGAWAEGTRRLGRIDDENLARKLASLIGEGQLVALRAATADLGNAIGTGSEQLDIPSRTALAEAVGDFGRSVGNYARVAAARVDETDRESVERFQRQMAPIDEYRASLKTITDEDEELDTDTDVTPEPPVVTPVTPAPTPVLNGV
jgi:hypothetical protein